MHPEEEALSSLCSHRDQLPVNAAPGEEMHVPVILQEGDFRKPPLHVSFLAINGRRTSAKKREEPSTKE
jgi:hypothetical protein